MRRTWFGLAQRKRAARSWFYLPHLEALENRCLLAQAIWTGFSQEDSNWMTPQNWLGNAAPSPGADLVFPAEAQRLTNVNNYPDGTLLEWAERDGLD